MPEKEAKIDASLLKSKTNESIPVDDKDEFVSKLVEIMENEKLYLDPELHIASVAIKLNMHIHQLSKLINIKLEKNTMVYFSKIVFTDKVN